MAETAFAELNLSQYRLQPEQIKTTRNEVKRMRVYSVANSKDPQSRIIEKEGHLIRKNILLALKRKFRQEDPHKLVYVMAAIWEASRELLIYLFNGNFLKKDDRGFYWPDEINLEFLKQKAMDKWFEFFNDDLIGNFGLTAAPEKMDKFCIDIMVTTINHILHILEREIFNRPPGLENNSCWIGEYQDN